MPNVRNSSDNELFQRQSNKKPTLLYHVDVYMPLCLREICHKNADLEYSFHAIQAAKTDRYGVIPLPIKFDATLAKLIEVETCDGFIVKQLWRQRFNAEFDLVIAITWESRVKTVWLNRVSDGHPTLQSSKYQKERKFK